MRTDYPRGVRLVVDPATKELGADTLFGGSPARMLRLSEPGRAAWAELCSGPVQTLAGARLARRLTDVGVLHPVVDRTQDVSAAVVIPVRDRADSLARCLDALGDAHPVVVVDDGSRNPSAVEGVCAARGALLVSHPVNRGPAAARNTGLAELATAKIAGELVLFLDSDCVPSEDLVQRLAGHFVDPLVGAAAPRILALDPNTTAERYAATAGSLDLGDQPGRVSPGSRLSYVPTAALLVRRAALDTVCARDGAFDTELRFGEDVDLVWRLDAAGWRVRYDPSVSVRHAEPPGWPALLRRRFDYGTSAGPLAIRHPGKLTPFVVHSWSGLAVLGILARRPLLAATGLAASVLTLRRALDAAEQESSPVVRPAASALWHTWVGTGAMATQFAWPGLLAALIPGRPAISRRAAVAGLLLAGPLTEWHHGDRGLDPVRFALGRVCDHVAYGAGVVTGSGKARTVAPLLPRVTRRLLRMPLPALRTVAPVDEGSAHA